MRPDSNNLVDNSRDFHIKDLFFSTTDEKGVITSCNQVFIDISAYPSTELLGKAHNIIRHPDMPRCVFKLLWDYLHAGKSIGAYVKNTAKTGEYYWVYALVMPTQDGYLSVRLKPTSPILGIVTSLYSELLSIEAAAGKDWRKGMEVSKATLLSKLATLGFASYDAFMTASLHTENSLRLKELQMAQKRPPGLYSLFENIQTLATLRELLLGKQAFFSKLGKRISLVAINARVSASKLSGEGQTLGVVSEAISDIAEAIDTQAVKLTSRIESLGILTQSVSFAFSSGTILSEMSGKFRSLRLISPLTEDQQVHLYGAKCSQSQTVLDEQYLDAMVNCEMVMLGISSAIREFQAYIRELGNLVLSLKMGYFVGKSTSASVPGAQQFALLLEDMNMLADTANTEVSVVEQSLDDVAMIVKTWQKHRRSASQQNPQAPSDIRMSA